MKLVNKKHKPYVIGVANHISPAKIKLHPHLVLEQYRDVTDTKTDRQIDGQNYRS